MHIYSVLSKNEGDIPLFVEEKFSFLALIFQVLWLIYHKLWQPTIIILLIKLGIYLASSKGWINESFGIAVNVTIAVTIAIFANSWYINYLKRNGYSLNSVIVAANKDEAKMRFFKNEDIDVR